MKIAISKALPATDELVEVLKKEFGGRYSFSLFGLGEEKTIIAGKSPMVGLQISVNENEITFDKTASTVAGSALFSTISFTELAVFLIPFFNFRQDPHKEFAKEIGLFLKQKYS